MAIRTVLDVEPGTTTGHRRWASALRCASISGPLRWLIAHHSVPPTEPWRVDCAECATPLWPDSTGPLGRCAHCGHRVGAPPLLIEALLIGAAMLVALSGYPVAALAATAVWLVLAIVLGTIDVLVHRLPLRLIAVMSGGTAGLLALSAWLGDRWPDLVRGLLAGAVLAGVMFLLALPRSGLGFGDVALGFPIGLALGWFGWATLIGWILVASLLTGLTGIILLAAGRATRKSRLPLGPFLLAAAILTVAVH